MIFESDQPNLDTPILPAFVNVVTRTITSENSDDGLVYFASLWLFFAANARLQGLLKVVSLPMHNTLPDMPDGSTAQAPRARPFIASLRSTEPSSHSFAHKKTSVIKRQKPPSLMDQDFHHGTGDRACPSSLMRPNHSFSCV